MAEYSTLLVSEADGVATIVVNRPDKLNALNATVLAELATAERSRSWRPWCATSLAAAARAWRS
jgi:enoyl-CoA hydratase/carnithine racemase